MKTQVFNTEGKKTEMLEIAKQWEEVPIAKQAMKDSVVSYLANQRLGTAKAKDRSEINFTTKKPWAQKGTGRARSGTASSPLWRKGGVVFGPKPRDFSIKLPKKVRRLALKSAISQKIKNNEIIIVEKIEIDKPKTKSVVNILKNLGGGKKPLIVTKESNRNLYLSLRNIPNLGLSRVEDLNTYIVLRYNKIIVEKDAWKELEEKILKKVSSEKPI